MVQIDFFPSWMNALIIAIVVLLIIRKVWQWFREQGSIWNLCRKHKSIIIKILVIASVLLPIAVFALGVHWALDLKNSYHVVVMFDWNDNRGSCFVVSFLFLFFNIFVENDSKWEIYWYVLLAIVVVFLYILSIAWGKAVIYLVLQTITLIPLYYMTEEKQGETDDD